MGRCVSWPVKSHIFPARLRTRGVLDRAPEAVFCPIRLCRVFSPPMPPRLHTCKRELRLRRLSSPTWKLEVFGWEFGATHVLSWCCCTSVSQPCNHLSPGLTDRADDG